MAWKLFSFGKESAKPVATDIQRIKTDLDDSERTFRKMIVDTKNFFLRHNENLIADIFHFKKKSKELENLFREVNDPKNSFNREPMKQHILLTLREMKKIIDERIKLNKAQIDLLKGEDKLEQQSRKILMSEVEHLEGINQSIIQYPLNKLSHESVSYLYTSILFKLEEFEKSLEKEKSEISRIAIYYDELLTNLTRFKKAV